MTTHLMTYKADTGSVVINGIAFSNGIGDGAFGVIFEKSKPANIEGIAWVDLRDVKEISIWEYDADPKSAQKFTAKDFDNALAIEFGFDADYNLVIWKLF